MARKVKTVNKFGGVEEVGKVKIANSEKFSNELFGTQSQHSDVPWQASNVEVESDTKLEDDKGEGSAAIIRCFQFGTNPTAFKEHLPTKQELFNSHLKGIETMLWRDGLKIMTSVTPQIVIGKTGYQIFVGAIPQKGHILHEKPQTLSEIAHA